MTTWSQLPKDLRHEVIKQMDFLQRFRFRGVSKTDQQLVDSTPLYIPRICFKSKKDETSVLTIYLGIENRIDLLFEKSKDRVTMKRCTKKLGSYTFANIFSIPFQIFASVALNPNTILGGFEFLPDVLTWEHACYIISIFQNRLLRTKILTIENGCWAFILAHCSIPDLLELQVIGTTPDANGLKMACQTKRVEYRMVGVSEEKMKEYNKSGTAISKRHCVITGEKHVEKLAESKKKFQKFLKDLNAEKVAPNNYRYYTKFPNGYMKVELTSCGVTMEFLQEKMERKDPKSCGMRWACAKHTDPFEHWYYTNFNDPVVFQLPDSIPIKLSGKLKYCEVVYPIINGVCSMDQIVQGTLGVFSKYPGSSIGFPIFRVRDGMTGEREKGKRIQVSDTLNGELEKALGVEKDSEAAMSDQLENLSLGN